MFLSRNILWYKQDRVCIRKQVSGYLSSILEVTLLTNSPSRLKIWKESQHFVELCQGFASMLTIIAGFSNRLFFLLIYAFSLYGTTSAAANRHPFPFKYIKQGFSYYAWAVCLLPRGKTSAPVRQSLSWQPTNFLSKLSKLLKVCFVRFEVFMFLTYGLS